MLFLFTTGLHAQPKYKIEHFATEQGLSHRRVNCMMKDQEGFMWFGTWDGINRFDGRAFVSYKSSPLEKYQLGNSRIARVVEDQNDHLWVQAYDYQIYRFDKKTEQFLPLSTLLNPDHKIEFNNILLAADGWVWLQTKNDGIFCISQSSQLSFSQLSQSSQSSGFKLPSNTISFFHIDKQKRVWIGTPNGLACLEASTGGIFTNSKIVSPALATGIDITAIQEDTDQVYFGLADGRLLTFEKRTKKFTDRKVATGRINALLRSKKREVLYASTSLGEIIIINLVDQQLTMVNYPGKENLAALYEDRSGGLWIEPEKLGAIRFDPQSRSFQLFSVNTGTLLNDVNNRYFWVLEDYKGTVWVSMKGRGFGYFNPMNKTIENVLTTPEGSHYQLPANITGHYYDSAGILWLTTKEGGLVKIIIQDNDFEQQHLVDQESARSGNEVRVMYNDQQGRLWLGTKMSGLTVFQNNKPVKGLFLNGPAGGVVGVYAILQDSKGNIWLGTKGDGLFKATPVNNEQTKYRLSHFQRHKDVTDSLPFNQIYSLLEDKQGRIWIGSLDNGLALIEQSSGTPRFIHKGNVFTNYPQGAFQNIRTMCLDKVGNIWLGTTTGLLVLNAGEQQATEYQYKSYSTIPGDRESLGNNDILFIYRDRKNRMWLATSGGGFCEAMGDPFRGLRFRNYTAKDGLPNDYILSCAEDSDGNVWLATENGLSKFNPDTHVFRNFDSYDALPPKLTFSEASVTKTQTGRQLIFGTVTGYLSFDPGQINANRIHATIAFTGFQINNEDAGPKSNTQPIPTDINYISRLQLRYNQNIISINYAILDPRGSGDRQGFAYRLVGFDTTWHNDWQFRKATYTNLPPGQYVFEVKSLSRDLYSNQPFKQLAITILPPPWKTGWAYLLYALFIGVVLFFIRRYALAMIRLRHKIAVEQKLAALKMNFFTNVSHELRTPLTLIVNPLEQVAKKGNLSPEMSSYVEVARRNASRMVRFINQLLDLRKVQSEKATLRISRLEMVTFVKKIADHFSEAARSKRIDLDIIADQKECIAWVDAEKLDVVIYNLLANAIKFTPEGRSIRILISADPAVQSFTIAVQDQGPGVPKDKLEQIFELFQEGAHTNGRELKGTGIGLALSREFVQLHGGNIWAENNPGGGLTVTVKLQLGAEHYKQQDASFVEQPATTPVVERPIEQQVLSQIEGNGVHQNSEAPLVLLVEDNDELRAFIKAQLSEYYRVETAKDGAEGLQKVIQLIPDLVVSDIMMPKMDGLQMLEKIKNDENTSHIPVVLLSAKYSIESQIEGLRYGADYYIPKPFNNEFLIASIDNLLHQRKKLFEALVEKKKAIELSPEPVVITSKDESFLKEVIKVVESKMEDPDFNIDTVAETMAFSRTNFYKKFKSLTTLTPMEFVRDMRLQRAKQYLDAGGHNISEVAYLTGFSNPKYFSTLFKEKYHVSPTDYIKLKNV